MIQALAGKVLIFIFGGGEKKQDVPKSDVGMYHHRGGQDCVCDWVERASGEWRDCEWDECD